jgi:tetratricopeptide (TPR) repeat protein
MPPLPTNRHKRRALVSLAGLLLLAAIPALAQQEGKRLALVIGNDAYSISPLKNAVNDARAMDKSLQSAGFRTVLLENGKKADIDKTIGEFLDMLGPDDTALFFYAGHGVQIDNENFLVPVDFEPGNSISGAKFNCISLAQIFDELNRKRAKRNIIILDACRSNPVADKYSLEAGLARPQNAGKETLIAYSTGPGQVAADNPDGRNSWFTESLSGLIAQPGLTVEINEIWNRVRKQVSDETAGRQTPWTISSLTSNFYFHPPQNQDAGNDPTLAEKWLDDAKRYEQREDWAQAIDRINQVLQKKPGGALEAAAKAKLPYLMARRDAQAQFETASFGDAAKLYDQSFTLDPFAMPAAFQGVNSYLLTDRFPEAVALLKAIRVRGTSEAIKKADAELQELAAVYPEAQQELQSGIPQPPPIEQVFSDATFGTPDWGAGARHLQATPVDLAKWTNELAAAAAPGVVVVAAATPAAAQGQAPADNPISAAVFHLEIVSSAETRDLVIRKIGGNAQPGPSGYVQVDGPPGDTPVTLDGAVVSLKIPAKLQLPSGKYEIRAVQDGKILNQQNVEVKDLSTITIAVKH